MADPKIFQSKRLLYRAIEDTPEDDDLVYSVHADPVGFANSNTGLIRPQSRRDNTNGFRKWLVEEALIAVIICILPEAEDGQEGKREGEGKNEKTEPKPPKPIPVGVIGLTHDKRTAHHRESHVSVHIGPEHQRKGYGSEAIGWVVQWGFCFAGLHRISIEALGYNEGAVRLYARLGFTPEGRTRQCIWFDGAWHDVVRFGMLEGEQGKA